MTNLIATQYDALEWGYTSREFYPDPFNTADLDVEFVYESGQSWRIPAYWAGGQEWWVRFTPQLSGRYPVSTICSDIENSSLHGLTETLLATPYNSKHPLLCHGPLRVAANHRTLEFSDGTPFFWLGRYLVDGIMQHATDWARWIPQCA